MAMFLQNSKLAVIIELIVNEFPKPFTKGRDYSNVFITSITTIGKDGEQTYVIPEAYSFKNAFLDIMSRHPSRFVSHGAEFIQNVIFTECRRNGMFNLPEFAEWLKIPHYCTMVGKTIPLLNPVKLYYNVYIPRRVFTLDIWKKLGAVYAEKFGKDPIDDVTSAGRARAVEELTRTQI